VGAAATFPTLFLLESVRCLECGDVYAKPVAGGTVEKNPGCPTCGYVGWLPVTLPGERARLRSVEDRQLLPFEPPH
jgi:predicted  nucleic acid-binding Zn-ribbon protein